MKYCDDCVNFKCRKGDKGCERGHALRFRSPANMTEAHSGDWGYYRRPRCPDFTAIPPPPVLVEVRCTLCGHQAIHPFHMDGIRGHKPDLTTRLVTNTDSNRGTPSRW